MNQLTMYKNAFAACDETRSPFAAAERKPPVFCPKPLRLGPLPAVADPVRPLRWHSCLHVDTCDSKAGAELLDIFLSKGGDSPVASSPPFFCCSPPSRAANPVVQDKRFGEDRPPAPVLESPLIQSGGSPMPPHKVCVRAKFGLTPATVRVEGFDCLTVDRRQSCSSSIPAMA